MSAHSSSCRWERGQVAVVWSGSVTAQQVSGTEMWPQLSGHVQLRQSCVTEEEKNAWKA